MLDNIFSIFFASSNIFRNVATFLKMLVSLTIFRQQFAKCCNIFLEMFIFFTSSPRIGARGGQPRRARRPQAMARGGHPSRPSRRARWPRPWRAVKAARGACGRLRRQPRSWRARGRGGARRRRRRRKVAEARGARAGAACHGGGAHGWRR
jgi:hypothetical protein